MSRRDLPRGLPDAYHDAAHKWLDSLVAQRLVTRRPHWSELYVRLDDAERVVIVFLGHDAYATADLYPTRGGDGRIRVHDDAWGHLDPVHDTAMDFPCPCEHCTRDRDRLRED